MIRNGISSHLLIPPIFSFRLLARLNNHNNRMQGHRFIVWIGRRVFIQSDGEGQGIVMDSRNALPYITPGHN
nr:hypothetical protein Q903MT_gene1749 [Picea sitchensis]